MQSYSCKEDLFAILCGALVVVRLVEKAPPDESPFVADPTVAAMDWNTEKRKSV